MDHEQLYNTWKEKRADLQPSPDFPDRVMNQVYQLERARRKPIFDLEPLLERLTTRPLVRVSLVAGALTIGVCRITITLLVLLG